MKTPGDYLALKSERIAKSIQAVEEKLMLSGHYEEHVTGMGGFNVTIADLDPGGESEERWDAIAEAARFAGWDVKKTSHSLEITYPRCRPYE